MGKKKKVNKLTRGYATTNSGPNSDTKRGVSSDLAQGCRNVQVSVKAHSELVELLDELKLKHNSSITSPEICRPHPFDVSPSNKKFLKKVTHLVRLFCSIINCLLWLFVCYLT